MKCLTSKEMTQIDLTAMKDYRLSGAILMENAGRSIVAQIEPDLVKQDQIVVVAGPGNNGGDGFVVARELYNRGYHVKLIQTVSNEKIAGDASKHFTILKKFGVPIVTSITEAEYELKSATLVIDALFGTGYVGPMREPAHLYVDAMNQTLAPIYSIDVPSGVSEDVDSMTVAVKATKTLIIEAPKVTAYIETTAPYYGKKTIVSIGLPCAAFHSISRTVWLAPQVQTSLMPRQPFGHKGTYGHVLLVGGSVAMPGAIQLSALGAVKSGAGLVSVMTDEATWPYLQLPYEVMRTSVDHVMTKNSLSKYQMIAFGMGLGIDDQKEHMLHQLLKQNVPLLIDADGLTLLGSDLRRLEGRNSPTVLTPHPKEFAMLSGHSVATIKSDPFSVTKAFAKKHGVYLILKGPYTIITSPEGEQIINTTGNSGLSKGGSGDLLSGICSVRMMQDKTLLSSLANAVFLHGAACDCAIKQAYTPYDVTPTDVANMLGEAFRTFIE